MKSLKRNQFQKFKLLPVFPPKKQVNRANAQSLFPLTLDKIKDRKGRFDAVKSSKSQLKVR